MERVAQTEPQDSHPAQSSRRWAAVGALAAITVLVGTIATLPAGVRNWDNEVKLQVAWNLLRGKGPILTEPTPDDETYVVLGTDGRVYSPYPLLASALQVVTIGAARLTGFLAEGLPYAFLLSAVALTLVAFGRAAGCSPGAAFAGAMLVCFGTALWPMVAHGYDVVVEVLALATILWAGARRGGILRWGVAGLAIGAAFATRLSAAILLVPAAVALLWPREAPGRIGRRVLAMGLGAAGPLASMLWYNAVRFGSPLAFSPDLSDPSSGRLTVDWLSLEHLQGIAGLAISPGKGVVWYGLPLLAALVLLRSLVQRQPAAYAALGAYLAAALVLFGRLVFWHGEWAWGPRYLAPLYVAAAPVAWALWDRPRPLARTRARAKGAIIGAVVLAALVQIPPVIGYPIESHLRFVVAPLAAQGRVVTRPVTRPPVPADNVVLYFDPRNSMLVSVFGSLDRLLDDPKAGPVVRRALARSLAAAVLLAAALLGVALTERENAAGGPLPAPEPRRAGAE